LVPKAGTLRVAFVIRCFLSFDFQAMLSLVEDGKLNLEEKLDSIEEEKLTAIRDLRVLKEDTKDKDMELEELKYKVESVLIFLGSNAPTKIKLIHD